MNTQTKKSQVRVDHYYHCLGGWYLTLGGARPGVPRGCVPRYAVPTGHYDAYVWGGGGGIWCM